MEKLRNILSPGHQHDDEVLYGTGHSDDPVLSGNTGKLSGQGTHFGQTRSGDESSTATGADPSATGNATSHILSPHQLYPDDGESTASIKSGVQGNPQSSGVLTGNLGSQGGLPSRRDGGISTSSPSGPHSSDPSDRTYQADRPDQTGSGGLGSTTAASGLGGDRSSEQDRGEGIAHIKETITERSYPAGGFSHNAKDEPSLTDNTSPHVPTQPQGEDHHYGRDAGMAGGAGAAGIAAYEATRDKPSLTEQSTSRPTGDNVVESDSVGQGYGTRESTQPSGTSGTKKYVNPYQTSHIDPRVDSNPRPTSRMPGAFDEDEARNSTGKDHHYGRDAGLAADGVGAGAYGASKLRDRSTDQPSVTSGTTSSAIPEKSEPTSTTGMTSGYVPGTDAKITDTSSTEAAPRNTADRDYTDTLSTSNAPRGTADREYGRNAGIAGAGAGALGAGAYGLQEHEDKPLPPIPDRTAPTSSYDQPSSTSQRATTSMTQPEEKDHHYGRDAGVAAAGVGAGAYGAHEYSKHQAEEAEKDRLRQEAAQRKQMEEDQRAREKAAAKEQKHHEKELQKEEKAHEKALAKEEKKHEKEQAAAIAAREKEMRREQERREQQEAAMLASQERERQQPSDDIATEGKKEKKGGLLGFLHKAKSHEQGEELEPEKDDSHKKEAVLGAAGVGGAGAAAYEYEKHHPDQTEPTTSTTTTGDVRGPAQHGTTSTYPETAGSYGTDKGLSRDTYDQSRGPRDSHAAETVGGAGVVGTGAYEAEKHLHKDPSSQPSTTRDTSDQPSATTQDTYDQPRRTQDTRDPSGTTRGTDGVLRTDEPQRTHDSHRGAETAASVGAVGAGAYGTEKLLHKDTHDQPSTTRDTYDQPSSTQASGEPRTVRGADGILRVEQPGVDYGHHGGSETGTSTGTTDAGTGGIGRDSHRGAETAAGLGAVGAGGVGAYEVNKHMHKDTYDHSAAPTTTTTRDTYDRSTAPTTSTTRGADDSLSREPPRDKYDSRHGAETAAGAGVLGGAGVAGYEADKHRHNDTYDQSTTDPTGTTRGGDSVLRTEEPQGKHESHRGTEAAAGAGVLGAGAAGYEADKHRHQDTYDQSKYGEPTSSHKTHNVLRKERPQDKYDSSHDTTAARQERMPDETHDSHRGAETAAGVGAVGAGAYGVEKLHERREADTDPTTTMSGYGHPEDKLSPTHGTGIGTERGSSIVIEPRTGLPMNLAKGTGAGGIDGGPIRGYQGDYEPNIVIEPRTGLPMNLDKGSGRQGAGGTDGTTPVPHHGS